MQDETILDLFWQRDEEAIPAAKTKYGPYCAAIARRILPDPRDAEECVSDTWLRAWNAIPPHRPPRLALFLGKITRETALNRWKANHAQERGGGEVPLALEELGDTFSTGEDPVGREVELAQLGQAISDFLRTQPPQTASLFLRRYYHLEPIRDLAKTFGLTESSVKTTLHRTRKKLKTYLEKEGFL